MTDKAYRKVQIKIIPVRELKPKKRAALSRLGISTGPNKNNSRKGIETVAARWDEVSDELKSK